MVLRNVPNEVDSAHNPLVQLVDLFVGFQKRRIDFGTGRANPDKIVEFYEGEPQQGEPRQCELSFYLFAGLRYSLWGAVRDYGWDPEGETPPQPFKHNLGYGVRDIRPWVENSY